MHALLFAVLTSTLVAQSPDTTTPPPAPDPDRIVIDAAAIVRDGGVQSLADLLNSRVPGLLVVSGSGLNGTGARIRFAGPRRLLSDDAPLILVDGIRVDVESDASLVNLGGPGPSRLEDFNVEDIESIEIIRNPAGAMLYGPGAADGAILITTKRGRSGSIQAEGYAEGALESVPARWPANYGGVDADNSDSLMRTGGCSLTRQAAGACVQDYVQSFNPLVQRSPFTTSIRHHAGFNATGGPRWGAFRLAAGIVGDAGVYSVPVVRNPNSYDRWNVTGSGTIRPDPRIDLGFSVNRLFSNVELPTYQPIQSALLGPSDSAGFAWTPLFGRSPRQRIDRFSGIAELNARPWPWLTARGLIGIDRVNQGDTSVVPGTGRLYGLRQVRQTTSSLTLSANAATGMFRFRTMVGVERATRRRRVDVLSGPDTDPFCGGVCASQTLIERERTLGLYVQEEVVVRERLVVTGALRHDDLSQFRRQQTNPSLAISWLAEPRLRLRAAYGSAREAGLADFEVVFVPIGTPIPVIGPDKVTSLEAGADAQLLGGRWQVHATVYDLRSDVLQQMSVSGSSGFYSTFVSGTKIGNRGIVATIGGPVLERKKLGWDVQVSVWGNRNRVLKLASAEFIAHGFAGVIPGYPAGGYWGERITGFSDTNGDGIIDGSEVTVDQRPTWAGTPYPTQGAGLQSTLRLGAHIRVSTTLDYRAGHVLLNESAWYRCQFMAVCRDRVDPRTPLERQALAVAPSYAVPLQYFEDADFLKLRELQLSFDVPPRTVGILGAHHATISLAARNLFTWTPYSGGDPEAGSYGTLTPGQIPAIADFGTVPLPRTWALRVRVSY